MNTSRRDLLLGLATLFAAAALPSPADARGSHAADPAPPKAARTQLGSAPAFDAQGRLWIAFTEPAGALDDGRTLSTIVLAWSADAGSTWTRSGPVLPAPEPVEANGEARPKLAFGPRGELYITFTSALARPHTGNIRFVRSLDRGATFSAPLTVQRDQDLTGHRFDSLIVDPKGRIFIAWIDKRDADAARAAGRPYRGAAIYFAVSNDQGASFGIEARLADHCCECCRIALSLDRQGRVVAMWRHIFAPNVRDHAMATLAPDGTPSPIGRASMDDWRIDACPHHGPALTFDAAGNRHQVWFSGAGEGSGLFYSNNAAKMGKPVPLGGVRAQHGEVLASGRAIAIVWKEFDGRTTQAWARWTFNNGASWQQEQLLGTDGASDHPHLVGERGSLWLVWRTQTDGVLVKKVGGLA